jgi:ATP-dependent Clp protease adaptor protein ClpS
LSNPAELINLSRIAGPESGPPRAASDQDLRACGEPKTDPYSEQIDPVDGVGPVGSGYSGIASGNSMVAPAGGHRPGAVRFPVGISNACAMLQLTSKFESSGSPAVAASAPRMGNDENRGGGGTGGPATSVIAKVKPKTKRPNLYRVLILNDDYTPMEFVVHVLEKFFQKDVEAATKIMLHVHHHGIGECGVFTYEIAETKVTQVMDFARKHQHPLQCVMEKK